MKDSKKERSNYMEIEWKGHRKFFANSLQKTPLSIGACDVGLMMHRLRQMLLCFSTFLFILLSSKSIWQIVLLLFVCVVYNIMVGI